MNILIAAGQAHIGGGNSYIEHISQHLTKNQYQAKVVSNHFKLMHYVELFIRRYQLVIINVYSPDYIWLCLFVFLIRVPSIFIVHGLWFLESQSINPQQSRFRQVFYLITQNIMVLLATRVVGVCEYQVNLIRKYFAGVGNKITIINGAADHSIFHPRSTSASLAKIRAKLCLPQKKKILLSITRIERRKGIDLLIKAMPKILNDHPDTLLLIVFPSGHFNQNEHLLELFELVQQLKIGRSVHFITGLHGPVLTQYYQAADLFVLSSKELENFSIAMMESLSCGCPLVCFKSGGSPEVISKVGNRFIVPKITANALAYSISSYLKLPNSVKQRYRVKAAQIGHHYSWEKSGQSLSQLIDQVVSG